MIIKTQLQVAISYLNISQRLSYLSQCLNGLCLFALIAGALFMPTLSLRIFILWILSLGLGGLQWFYAQRIRFDQEILISWLENLGDNTRTDEAIKEQMDLFDTHIVTLGIKTSIPSDRRSFERRFSAICSLFKRQQIVFIQQVITLAIGLAWLVIFDDSMF